VIATRTRIDDGQSRRIDAALSDFRTPVWGALQRILQVEDDAAPAPLRDALYGPILDYVVRSGKGMRPALCLAVCRALGGALEEALPTAAVLELFHCAFLIHDDVEDGSSLRRGAPSLHAQYGVPVAVNCADAMLAMALQPLLDNTRILGLGRALLVLEEVARMAQITAEGQAIELDWIRRGSPAPDEGAYVDMVEKKTATYSFVAPVRIGAIVAGAGADCVSSLTEMALHLGVAFQIRDDVLNLRSSAAAWGKDRLDDLWEGKRTLILTHALAHARPEDRQRALEGLSRARPKPADLALSAAIERLAANGALAASGRAELEALLAGRGWRCEADVEFMMRLIEETGSLDYAASVARRFAEEARAALERCGPWLRDGSHRDFLVDLTEFVVDRQY
jgi:geranylgeranyl diphosphate synthase type II